VYRDPWGRDDNDTPTYVDPYDRTSGGNGAATYIDPYGSAAQSPSPSPLPAPAGFERSPSPDVYRDPWGRDDNDSPTWVDPYAPAPTADQAPTFVDPYAPAPRKKQSADPDLTDLFD
jgi:hypothetical protein